MDAGISIPFVGKIMKRVVDWTIFDITLYEFSYQAPVLRHFTAEFEPLYMVGGG